MGSPSPRRLSRAATLLAALVLTFFPAVARADGPGKPSKLDSALQERQKGGGANRERVIIRVKRGKRADLVQALKGAGHSVKAEHPLIDAVTVEVPIQALQGLAHRSDVKSISFDAPTTAFQTVAPTATTLRSTLGSSSTGTSGEGVGVAVIDSGISPLNVFDTRIVAFYDFTWGWPRATSPTDPYGHGTHVAGLIAGSGAPSRGLYGGIATKANLIGLRVLDGSGRGQTSHVISAIEYAVANRSRLGIDVLNLSLGHPIYEPAATDPLVQAVEAAVRYGLVVVVSAGNYGMNPDTREVGYGGISSPGNAPSAITVGAVDTKGTSQRLDDAVAAYSSRGPTWYDGYAKPDVVAPGHALTAIASQYSTLYNAYPNARATAPYDYNKYLRLNGTSMAAAVTSGAVAQMIAAQRSSIWWTSRRLPPNAIKAILQFTSIRMRNGVPYYDFLTQGAGAINALGAVEFARRIDPSRAVGSYWMTSWLQPSSLLAGSTLSWAQHLVWGSHLVWGNSVYYHELGWDEPSTWGTLGGTHIVWGTVDPTHLVWGNHLVWGTHIVWGNVLVGTTTGSHIVWGTAGTQDNIVWGSLSAGDLAGNVDGVTGNNAPDVTLTNEPIDPE